MHDRPRLSATAQRGVRRRRGSLLTAVAGLAVVLLLAGATAWWRGRPVQVVPPPGAADPACARLAQRLPATVRRAGRVATTSGSSAVAAWGRPALVWRCGVSPPGPTTRDCLSVDGVDWVEVPLADGTSFTTYGREPAVQVLVPHDGSPDPLVLPTFSAVVSDQPQGERRCR